MEINKDYYIGRRGYKVYPIFTITKEWLIEDFDGCDDEEFYEWLKNLDDKKMSEIVQSIDDHVEIDWEDIKDGIFDVYKEDCDENAQKNKDTEWNPIWIVAG